MDSKKILDELKFWLHETISYKDGMKATSVDRAEVKTLKSVVAKIEEMRYGRKKEYYK